MMYRIGFGGAGGLIILVLALVFGGGDPGSLLSEFNGADPTAARQGTANTPSHCKTGADANRTDKSPVRRL